MRCSFFLSLRISICSGVIGEAFGVLPVSVQPEPSGQNLTN
ncbi:hypothetical protein SD22575_1874 [Shigella dysenteriae 225-75]|nr:hypothetical protein SD22575_1874 [Shigella dysenteriae 225-75]